MTPVHRPGEDPIGRPVAIDWDDLEPWTVIGVVEDVVHTGMEDGPRETVYHPARQAPYFPIAVGLAATTVPALRAIGIRPGRALRED